MSQHEIRWADGGYVGYSCGDSPEQPTLSREDENPRCEVCGKVLRLIWDVRIVEVGKPVGYLTSTGQLFQPHAVADGQVEAIFGKLIPVFTMIEGN